MKFISIFYKTAIVVALVVSVTSCSDDDDNIITPPVTLDIIETVQRNTDLASLVTALGMANGDLSNVLKGDGPFTVLAPTNAAFEKFITDNGFSSDFSDVPKDVLESILLNHVISGTLRSSDLESGDGVGYITTESNAGFDGSALSLYYNTSSGVQFNGGATVNEPDTEATNGIIHIIDAVIGLPDVTTFATADPNFSRLVQGLTAHDSFDYITTLEGDGPFTVFAPDNAAFDALLDSDETTTVLSDIPEATLKNALDLHVISGSNVRKADLTNGDVTTLGGNILVDATDGQETLADGSQPNAIVSNITATDVQATNGIIHIIDNVLLTARPN